MRWRTPTDARLLLWLAVAAGLLLRAWHYAANHTIWYDEAVLLVNVMGKDFAGLLGPLHHEVAAPPLFVWLLKLIHLAGGDQPYLWRLPPFLFSVGGLLVTVPLARRVFPPHLAAFAVAMVAMSDNHLWLGCCVKPYAGDTLVTTALLLYLVGTTHWPVTKRLLVLAAVTPVLFAFSYTATLGVGAVLLALAPAAWKERPRGWTAWAIAAAVAAATVAVLYFGPIKAQRVPRLVEEWTERGYFPNFADPLSLPWWLLKNLTGACQYTYLPSGFVFGLLAPVGGWALWKSGKREVVIACGGLFALALVAAAVKAYPLGQHRLSQFLAPAVLLLGVAGVGEVVRWWKWVGVGLAVLLVAVVSYLPLSRFVRPWPQPDAQSVQRYVRQHRQPGEAVLSDEKNYLYFFFGEVKPLVAGGAEVPPGGRAWVVMDFYTDAERRHYIEQRLTPLGFEYVAGTEKEFGLHPSHRAAAYLYQRK